MSSDISKKDEAPDNTATGDNSGGGSTGSGVPDGVNEDVYRFWKQNGSRIILYTATAIVAFVGVQVWNALSSQREDSLRSKFADLDTTEERIAFADKHKSHGLAAYAYLQAAKEAYENQKFEESVSYYAAAAESLENSPLLGVALLGQASSEIELSEISSAIEILEAVAEDETIPSGVRSEAIFKRIVLAYQQNDAAVAEDYTTQLTELDKSGFWMQRLDSITNYQ